jgi:hypothetical protein
VDRGGYEWAGGFLIEILLPDDRDLENDLYTIRYQEGSNTAVYTRPALPACYRFDKTAYERVTATPAGAAADAPPSGALFQRGQDIARSAFADLPDVDKYQKFTLQFPDGFQITESPYRVTDVGGTQNSVLKLAKIENVIYSIGSGIMDYRGVPAGVAPTVELPSLHYRARWKFADKAKATKMAAQAGGGAAAVAAARQGLLL